MYKKYMNNLYMFIFIFWYSTELIFNTTLKSILGVQIETINSLVNWLIFALLILQIVVFQSYRKKELVIIIGITLPIIIATIFSGNRTMLSAWMFIVAAKNIKLDKIIYVAYIILLTVVPIIIFLCIVGVIEDYTMMRGSIQRFSLGFSHPNQLGLRIFQLIVCHCYVNRKKLARLNYFCIILAILFAIKIPNSQTSYICMAVFLLLLLTCKYIENHKRMLMDLLMRILFFSALLLNMFSVIFSFFDINKSVILSQLDKWMSMRFSLCHKVWMIFGISIFGQKVYISEEERKLVGITSRLWLDNAYVSILLRYGILVYALFSIFYLYLIRRMTRNKEYILVIILFLYSLYGVMENGLYMLTNNIFLIAFSHLLYGKNINELNSKDKPYIESADDKCQNIVK